MKNWNSQINDVIVSDVKLPEEINFLKEDDSFDVIIRDGVVESKFNFDYLLNYYKEKQLKKLKEEDDKFTKLVQGWVENGNVPKECEVTIYYCDNCFNVIGDLEGSDTELEDDENPKHIDYFLDIE